jgi:hypothetical protein
MTRNFRFNRALHGSLQPAPAGGGAVLEVLTVPEEYTDAAVQAIAETVFTSGAFEGLAAAAASGTPVRITWAALLETGIMRGVLEEKDA